MPDLIEIWRDFIPRILRKGEREPVDSVHALEKFVSTRSAFIAQKCLYGYLKTRMGTQFPQMFEDDTFAVSINIAKMNIYDACLSDLAVYATAVSLDGSSAQDETRRRLAARCHGKGLDDNTGIAVESFSPQKARQDFQSRLTAVAWHGSAKNADCFTKSPDALVRWAPIVKQHKDLDVLFVKNSIRYAWIDMRRILLRKLDRKAIADEVAGWEETKEEQE